MPVRSPIRRNPYGRRALAIVDDAFGDAEIEALAVRSFGVDVEYTPGHSLDLPESIQGILVRRRRLTTQDIQKLRHVRVIGRYGVGTDGIDLDAARRGGISVVNVADYCAEEVGQHALALILTAWRRIPVFAGSRPDLSWTELSLPAGVRPLSECTLGIVGGGRSGTSLARQALPIFGTITVLDPKASAPPGATAAATLHDLLTASDVVSLHCPLTAATTGLMNRRTLKVMRPGSLLVNVSRGEVVASADLLGCLDDGRPALAALDVVHDEPPGTFEQLRQDPRILTTPHMAWYSDRSISELRRELAMRCARLLCES